MRTAASIDAWQSRPPIAYLAAYLRAIAEMPVAHEREELARAERKAVPGGPYDPPEAAPPADRLHARVDNSGGVLLISQLPAFSRSRTVAQALRARALTVGTRRSVTGTLILRTFYPLRGCSVARRS
jgi:hypothetical protein